VNNEQPNGWKRFTRLKFNSKDVARRVKKAEGATVRHARRFVFKRLNNIREVRRHITIWFLMVGYIIAASALQLLWYQQGYRTTAAAAGGTYAEAVLGPINTLNPLFASTSAEQSASQLMFSRLMTFDTSGHLNYDIASDMSVDSTQKVYTVKIRPDAMWQDGQPLTADDVAFTVNLIKNPVVRSTITGWNDIKVAVVDPTTVTFTLPVVYAAFPYALNFPILPQHLLKDIDPSNLRESSFSTNPVGSGPFSFRLLQTVTQPTTQQVVHMVRNDHYYNGAPKLERFQLDAYTTQDQILQALSSAEVSGAVDLSDTNAAKVDTKRYSVQHKPINAGVYALLNTTGTILSDKTVRQALQMGTDTQAIRQALGGSMPDLYLPFVNGQLTGPDVPAKPTVNVAQAKAMLENDGWKLDSHNQRTKNGQVLKLDVVTIKDPDLQVTIQKLADQWKALGVGVNMQVVDPNNVADNVVQNILQPRAYDVLIYQLNIGGDPDVYAYWHSSQATQTGFNFSNYNNPLSDDALSSARSRLEPALRNAKYITFAKQWLSDVPAIGLYQSTVQYVSNRQIDTLQPSDRLVSAVDRFNDVQYWTVATRSVFTTP